MNINLAWRIVIFIAAIIAAVIIVPIVASLIINGTNYMAESITDLFRPFTLPREARMQGLIELCIYLVTITFLIRSLFRR